MDGRIKAGLKAGGLCSIGTFVIQSISSAYMTSTFIYVIGWILYFMPGILAVHFGRNAIKNGKGAAVSIVVAITVFSLFLISTSIFLLLTSSSTWLFEDDPLFFILVTLFPFIVAFLFTTGLSMVGGLAYAKYRLGIPIRGQKKVTPRVQPKSSQILYCPQCRNKIEKNWVSCPYCGAEIKDNTRIYDGDTRIYDNETRVY